MENPGCSWLQSPKLGSIPFLEKVEILCGKSAVHKVTDGEKGTGMGMHHSLVISRG